MRISAVNNLCIYYVTKCLIILQMLRIDHVWEILVTKYLVHIRIYVRFICIYIHICISYTTALRCTVYGLYTCEARGRVRI